MNIHFAEGMGVLTQNSRDITLERFHVQLRPPWWALLHHPSRCHALRRL